VVPGADVGRDAEVFQEQAPARWDATLGESIDFGKQSVEPLTARIRRHHTTTTLSAVQARCKPSVPIRNRAAG